MNIRLYTDSWNLANLDNLLFVRYILVLDVGRNLAFSTQNFAYISKIDAVANIWKRHPNLKLILSRKADGDLYNETEYMLRSLKLTGIPIKSCYIDNQSYTTFGSISRYKNQFGYSPIIVSTRAHLKRVNAKAKTCNMESIAFEAKGFPITTPISVHLSNYLSRVKACLILWELLKYDNKLSNKVLKNGK